MENKTVTINGVMLTEQLLCHLETWELDIKEENYVNILINELNKVQDLLCETLWVVGEVVGTEKLQEGIKSVFLVKEELLPFLQVPDTANENL